jgi:hypothetical protein
MVAVSLWLLALVMLFRGVVAWSASGLAPVVLIIFGKNVIMIFGRKSQKIRCWRQNR